MDLVRLIESPVGAIIPISAPAPDGMGTVEGHGFLPDALPLDVTLATPTWTTVNAATAALARLDGAAQLIPNPALLRRPALRREAQSTSALEGTYAPFADVLAADAEDDDAVSLSAELQEILNFERMANLAFEWPHERPLTASMLGELQQTLVRGTRGELSDAGRLRDRVVMIGPRGGHLDMARFVPPPPGDQLQAGVEALLAWVNSPPELPAVVQAAMVHYQFETLHPYSDGNGRLGRLLVIVQLLRTGTIREPLLVVSPWFEQRRAEYQDALLELSCTGDWDAWVAFFAEGVRAAASESQRKVEQLVALQEELRARVRAARRKGAVEQIAADLVGQPFVTVPAIARRYGLSSQGASNAVKALVEIAVLESWDGVRLSRAQMYRAPEVMGVLGA